jgi:hypothetical protein
MTQGMGVCAFDQSQHNLSQKHAKRHFEEETHTNADMIVG